MRVFHLVEPAQWPARGEYRPGSLDDEGFVHLSFAGQVAGSADRHFPDATSLMAVEFDSADLEAAGVPVRVEDSRGDGTGYPHAYGAIPVAAAVAVHPVERAADGRWCFAA